MEIFGIFKSVSFVIFVMLVLLSITEKSRDGYFLAAMITLVINFWVCAKLGENPNVLAYIIALVIYVLAIVIIVWRDTKKGKKPIVRVKNPGVGE